MACNCSGDKVWKFSDPEIDISLLEPDLIKYADTEGSLITILQKAQELYGYLPVDLLAYISHRIGVKPAKVMGVVTFYTQFRTKPIGKNLILLCQGTACHVNGSVNIEEAIREHLDVEEGEISGDGLFTYNNVACLGCCSLAPAMMIGEKTYGNLTKDKTVKVLKEIKQSVNRDKEAAQ
jgi:NADH-quinone oxidoreductase subunit E